MHDGAGRGLDARIGAIAVCPLRPRYRNIHAAQNRSDAESDEGGNIRAPCERRSAERERGDANRCRRSGHSMGFGHGDPPEPAPTLFKSVTRRSRSRLGVRDQRLGIQQSRVACGTLGLVFGHGDDYEACREIADLLVGKYELARYRCIPANGSHEYLATALGAIAPSKLSSQNLEAVLDALRKAGVELPDENTIRLVKRRR
jgi:hypothetical protein